MKALILTREYPPDVYGGAGVHVAYLSRALAKLMPMEVRTFGDQSIETANLIVRGHPVARAPSHEPTAKFLPALEALRVCVGFNAWPIDADVVHCHTWYVLFGGLLARMLYGIPLVITAHSLEPLRPWKREQLGRGADLSAWIEKTVIEAADAVVAVSEEMKTDILRHFSVARERVTVIHNGIDVEEYRPVASRAALERYGIDARRPYVLFVGRVSRQKGVLHLLNAVPYLDPAAQVVICAGAADTPDIAKEVEGAVHRIMATRSGMVWIPEMVDQRSAIELYTHAAVFCCPSLYEPFGIVNLEAMACETAVVATAVGGIPEVVVHGETGLLVPVGIRPGSFEPLDPDGFSRVLARHLNGLLADERTRRAMGVAGRRRAEARFSWDAIARQVHALYDSVVRAAGNGGSR